MYDPHTTDRELPYAAERRDHGAGQPHWNNKVPADMVEPSLQYIAELVRRSNRQCAAAGKGASENIPHVPRDSAEL